MQNDPGKKKFMSKKPKDYEISKALLKACEESEDHSPIKKIEIKKLIRNLHLDEYKDIPMIKQRLCQLPDKIVCPLLNFKDHVDINTCNLEDYLAKHEEHRLKSKMENCKWAIGILIALVTLLITVWSSIF